MLSCKQNEHDETIARLKIEIQELQKQKHHSTEDFELVTDSDADTVQ